MSKHFVAPMIAAAVFAMPAFAEETEGLVLAFDRQDRIIVLTDKTVWTLPDTIDVPDDLAHGDRVLFDFENAGDDEGMTEISSMDRLSKAIPEGTDGGS